MYPWILGDGFLPTRSEDRVQKLTGAYMQTNTCMGRGEREVCTCRNKECSTAHAVQRGVQISNIKSMSSPAPQRTIARQAGSTASLSKHSLSSSKKVELIAFALSGRLISTCTKRGEADVTAALCTSTDPQARLQPDTNQRNCHTRNIRTARCCKRTPRKHSRVELNYLDHSRGRFRLYNGRSCWC